jgi:fibronectin-binding autotransporter adhesin
VWLDGRLGGNGVVGSPVSCEPGGGISPGQGTNSPGTLTIANSLTLNNALNDFDLSDDASGTIKTNDLLNVSGSLTLLGTNTLTIHKLNSTLPPGIYPLINYSGALSGGLNNFTVAGLDGTPLALTNPPGQIALVVKSVRAPANLVWKGGQNGNAWDLVTTSNFFNGAVQDFFVPQDSVTFNDSGAANTNVNLSGTLIASNVVVNSTSNYVFNGSGVISGTGGVTKTNSGTLTINNDNSYTGRTVIGGGVLEVNDLSVAGASGPLGAAPNSSPTNLVIYGGATLRFTGPQAYTDRGLTLQSGTNTLDVVTYGVLINCSGLVTGGGALQKLGQGTFILGASNSYSGGTIIKAGVVQLATEAANQYGFGSGTVTLDGGILKMLDDSGSYSTASYNIFVPTNSFGELDCDSRIDLYGSPKEFVGTKML